MMRKEILSCPWVCAGVSPMSETIMAAHSPHASAKYVVVWDAMDGTSNLHAGVNTGEIHPSSLQHQAHPRLTSRVIVSSYPHSLLLAESFCWIPTVPENGEISPASSHPPPPHLPVSSRKRGGYQSLATWAYYFLSLTALWCALRYNLRCLQPRVTHRE